MLITLPIQSNDHVPYLPEVKKIPLTFGGRIVQWIHSWEAYGQVYTAIVYAFTLMIALALIVSVIGIPIVIYLAKESVRQMERNRFDSNYENLLKIGSDYSVQRFLIGRIAPLDGVSVNFKPVTRNKIIQDLEIKDSLNKTDSDLLRIAAARYTDYIIRYNLKIVG